MIPVVVGIDIGGTNTRFAIIDRDGTIISNESVKTTNYSSVEDFTEVLSEKIKDLSESVSGNYLLKAIGIGSPNGNFQRGTIEYATNLTWKGVIPFVDLMKKFIDVPLFITNDAKAAAIGEMIYGGAKGMKDFVVITLGTGLGSGFVVNGNVVYGHSGFAGELGHTIIEPDGRVCGCGRKGCLETYVSATGITKTVIELLENTFISAEKSLLSYYRTEDLNSKLIYEAAEKNDKLALRAFDFTGKLLGRRLADMVTITSPEAIFLFGGLTGAGEFIFKPTQYYFDLYLLKHFKGTVKLLPSGIEHSNAGVLGASALAWSEAKFV